MDTADIGSCLRRSVCFRLGRSKTPEILLHTMEEFTGMIRESKGYTGWAEKTERKLIRNGAKYHFGKTITPMKYLTGRIVLAFWGRSVC